MGSKDRIIMVKLVQLEWWTAFENTDLHHPFMHHHAIITFASIIDLNHLEDFQNHAISDLF
jgi:hypothetical protein